MEGWGTEEMLDCYLGDVVFVRVEEEGIVVSGVAWFVGCYSMSADV